MPLMPLASLLQHHGERKPRNAVAVRMGPLDHRLQATWRDLETQANRRAALLRSAGVRPGDMVTIALDNSIAFFETTFAVWKAGAIPNIVAASLPLAELQAIVDVARPAVVVTERPITLGGWKVLPIDASLAGFGDEAVHDAPAAHWKAMTSGGSSGRPKVIIDHAPALWDPEQTLPLMPRDGVVFNPGPLYHNAPFTGCHGALFVGSEVSSLIRFDPEETLKVIAADRAQWLCLVPTMMSRMLALPEAVRRRYDLGSIQAIWHGAAATPPSVKMGWIDWLGPERVFEIYGATEGLGTTVISGVEWLARRGSVGRPVGGARVKVVGEDGQELAPGEIGEIYFLPATGPGTTYHYLGADSKPDTDGWESVGDIGWLDADGYLYLADRRVDLILRGGENIYPAEIEGLLSEHPAVAEAVVLGLPDPDLGHRVHAMIELKAGEQVTAEELDAFLAGQLVRFKRPESYEFVHEHLRDDAGKVRRSALRDARAEQMASGQWTPERVRRPAQPGA